MRDWKAICRVFKARNTFNYQRISLIACIILLIFICQLEFHKGYEYNGKDYSAKSKEEAKEIADIIINEGFYALPRYDNIIIKAKYDRVDILEPLSFGLKYVDQDEIKISCKVYDWTINTFSNKRILFKSSESSRFIVATYNDAGAIGISTMLPANTRQYNGLIRMIICLCIFIVGAIVIFKVVFKFTYWHNDFKLAVDYYREIIDEEEEEELKNDLASSNNEKETQSDFSKDMDFESVDNSDDDIIQDESIETEDNSDDEVIQDENIETEDNLDDGVTKDENLEYAEDTENAENPDGNEKQ